MRINLTLTIENHKEFSSLAHDVAYHVGRTVLFLKSRTNENPHSVSVSFFRNSRTKMGQRERERERFGA